MDIIVAITKEQSGTARYQLRVGMEERCLMI